jgi:lysophospholipase L1-like esterase
MAAALAVPYTTESLRPLRVIELPWDRAADTRLALALPERVPPAFEVGEWSLPATENTPTVNNALPAGAEKRSPLPDLDPAVRDALRHLPVEDASGHALDALMRRLAQTDGKEAGAVTRVLYYGDSIIASDYISGTVRRRLQARFGDAGHGFVLVAQPFQWYFHNDVTHGSEGAWKASRIAGPIVTDARYGLGGVSFQGYGGDVAWFGTATRGDFGRKVSRFDVYYLEQPGGADVDLSVSSTLQKGQPAHERLATRGEVAVPRVHSVRVPDGEARLTLRTEGGGQARLFGVALEREVPGVVVDALGYFGGLQWYLTRQDHEDWRQAMKLRDPALLVLQYGTNENWIRGDPKAADHDRSEYERVLGELVDELRALAPEASLLVVAPPDRAENIGGRVATRAATPDVVAIQRRVALAHGVAFWSAFDAMGGEGSMVRWAKARPQLGGDDLIHPTPLGAEVLGDLLSDAILEAYARWSAAAPPRPVRAPSRSPGR